MGENVPSVSKNRMNDIKFDLVFLCQRCVVNGSVETYILWSDYVGLPATLPPPYPLMVSLHLTCWGCRRCSNAFWKREKERVKERESEKLPTTSFERCSDVSCLKCEVAEFSLAVTNGPSH